MDLALKDIRRHLGKFFATIVGVAALSGQVLRWQPTEQLVAFAVLGGIVWLLMRTGS
mgnify:CR=1 FL=1